MLLEPDQKKTLDEIYDGILRQALTRDRQVIEGEKIFQQTPKAPLDYPVTNDQLVNKLYVDRMVAAGVGSTTSSSTTDTSLERRIYQLKLVDDTTSLATGDGKIIFCIPEELNGYDLIRAEAAVSSFATTGSPTYQVRNISDSVDMLTTKITIDSGEYTSYTAAITSVIDTTKDTVQTGDLIAIDKDSQGTASQGDLIILSFRKPNLVSDSNLDRRIVELKLADEATAVTVGDGKFIFCVPLELNGYDLVAANAAVSSISTLGRPTYQIRNITDSVDMLSTKITIDSGEFTSYTSDTVSVVDITKDNVSTGDLIAIDKDSEGTGSKGDIIMLSFKLP